MAFIHQLKGRVAREAIQTEYRRCLEEQRHKKAEVLAPIEVWVRGWESGQVLCGGGQGWFVCIAPGQGWVWLYNTTVGLRHVSFTVCSPFLEMPLFHSVLSLPLAGWLTLCSLHCAWLEVHGCLTTEHSLKSSASQVWTDLAEKLTDRLEETMTAAFSQVTGVNPQPQDPTGAKNSAGSKTSTEHGG